MFLLSGLRLVSDEDDNGSDVGQVGLGAGRVGAGQVAGGGRSGGFRAGLATDIGVPHAPTAGLLIAG